LFLAALCFALEDGLEPLGERVFVDVVLIVQLGIWIARNSFVCCHTFHLTRTLCIVPIEHVGSTELLEILQLGLKLELVWLVLATASFAGHGKR